MLQKIHISEWRFNGSHDHLKPLKHKVILLAYVQN